MNEKNNEFFTKIEASKMLEEFKKYSKKSQPKPVDLTDNEGKVYVTLKQLRYGDFINKIRLLEKLNQIISTISPSEIQTQESVFDEETEKRKRERAEKLKRFLMEEEKEIKTKGEKEKEIVGTEKVEEVVEEKKEEIEEKVEESIAKEEYKKPTFKPVIEELVKDTVKEEIEEVIIENEETYSKVKEGVGISYIDDHHPPSISNPCPGGDIDKRSEEIINEIYEGYISSKKVSKAELSKQLVDLTRYF